MADVKLVVRDEPIIKIRVTDPVIKPTQTKTVTPAYEEQTVLPDAGYTLGQVDVEAIPLPSGVIDIDENGEYEVAGYGAANVHVPQPSGSVDIHENGSHNVTDFEVANVNVQPDLQTKEVTPTEQAQTILPDTGYDGLESVEVARIPTEYIVPTGTKNISQNGTESVREYDSVNVNVPIPPEYIIPTGTKTITENGTGINVREFERVDVSVSAAAQLVLLDTINVGDFAEQVNMVNIDLSNYDLTGYNVLYIVVDNIVSSGADWLYFNADGYSACYFDGSKTTHNAKKAIQYNDGMDWLSVLGLTQATGRFPGSGDPAAVNIVHFKFYKAATTFVSGRFLIYAI